MNHPGSRVVTFAKLELGQTVEFYGSTLMVVADSLLNRSRVRKNSLDVLKIEVAGGIVISRAPLNRSRIALTFASVFQAPMCVDRKKEKRLKIVKF